MYAQQKQYVILYYTKHYNIETKRGLTWREVGAGGGEEEQASGDHVVHLAVDHAGGNGVSCSAGRASAS